MIEFNWPWIFLLLPLPFLVRRFLSPAPLTRTGSLRVPFFDDLAETRTLSGRVRGANLVLLLLSLIHISEPTRPY